VLSPLCSGAESLTSVVKLCEIGQADEVANKQLQLPLGRRMAATINAAQLAMANLSDPT